MDTPFLTVFLDCGDDTFIGQSNAEVVHGGTGKHTLEGGFGDDTLFGDAGNDTISGEGNSDFIIGGLGKDSLTGGEGDDFFSFTSAKDSVKGANHDVIEDFDILIGEHDQIDLRSIDAKKGHGNQAFHFIGAAKGDTNGDGKADFQIEVHSGELLAKGDFLL